MATQSVTRTHADGHTRTGGVVEICAAAAGIALAIIGLAGVAPRWLDAIAVIVLGAAFLFERYSVADAHHTESAHADGTRELTAESLAGWGGIVLGILSLLRVAPMVLVPIALIAFGGGLVLGAPLVSRAFRLVIGFCGIVLGILALLQLDPRTLTLIGMIAVGGVLLLTGPALADRWHGLSARHPVAS